jgi:hypothetical protein
MKKKTKIVVTGERNRNGLIHFPLVTLSFQDLVLLGAGRTAFSERCGIFIFASILLCGLGLGAIQFR